MLRLRSAIVLASLLMPFARAVAETPDIPLAPPPPPRKQSTSKAPPPSAAPARAASGAPSPAEQPTAAAPATPPVMPAASGPEAKAAARKEVRHASTLTGKTGLLRVASADASPPGTLRLSFGFDFFRVGTFFSQDDGHSRVGGTLSLSGAATRWLELWLSTRAQSNSNDRTQPRLLQTQGDLTLGAKVFYPLLDLLSIGGIVEATLLSGIGSNRFDLGATQLALHAVATSDLSKAFANVPLRLHVEAGILVDNSGSLPLQPLTNAERFAFGISDYHRFQLALGIEAPFKYVTPYIEYGVEFPFGYLATPGIVLTSAALRAEQTAGSIVRTCDLTDESACARPAVPRALPQHITLGARLTAMRDLTLDAAFDIGLTPEVATGIVATPPYTFLLLASYAFDPFHDRVDAGPPISVPVLIPESDVTADEPTGKILGMVRSKGDGREVAGAVVAFDRSPPVATAPSGAFRSHDLEPGPVTLTVTRDGYEDATAFVEIVAGREAEVEVELIPRPRSGLVKGTVVDASGKPLAGISVRARGPQAAEVKTDESGAFTLETGQGRCVVEASGEGFLKKTRSVEVAAGGEVRATFALSPRPKEPLAEVVGKAIIVKESVPFVNGEAKLTAEARPILDAVLDILASRDDIKRVRIAGHTDNVGVESVNLALSRNRASAVLEYFVEQGQDRARLDAEGFGSTRPIAPNLTRRGREQNRRIEFEIAEQQ